MRVYVDEIEKEFLCEWVGGRVKEKRKRGREWVWVCICVGVRGREREIDRN